MAKLSRRQRLIINAEQQRRVVFGGILLAIILLNVTLLLGIAFDPEIIEYVSNLAIFGWALLELLVVIAVAYISLIVSHRIAGPAFAIIRDLRRIGEGNLTVRTALRRNDFYIEMGDTLRETTERLCHKLSRIQQMVDRLDAGPPLNDEASRLIVGLKKELLYFRTDSRQIGTPSIPENEP